MIRECLGFTESCFGCSTMFGLEYPQLSARNRPHPKIFVYHAPDTFLSSRLRNHPKKLSTKHGLCIVSIQNKHTPFASVLLHHTLPRLRADYVNKV